MLDLNSTKYSSGAFSYRDPAPDPTLSSMTGGDDKVVVLSHRVFDDAGNIIEKHSCDMNHDDTGVSTGINLTNNNDYVRSSTYAWYDNANRTTTVGTYGSGDTATGAGQWKYAAAPSRPATAPTASSDTVLITKYSYDSTTGRRNLVTDPIGYETKTFFDDAGQKTWVAEHYDDFAPDTLSTISDPTDDSKDRVFKLEYDGAGNRTKMIAYNGSGSSSQDTVHLFEDAVSVSRSTNTIYPDSSDTASTGTNQLTIVYNVDGSPSQTTDQRGTVISFSFDELRRQQSQKVTSLGGSTDGTVRSITKGYDSLGRVAKLTSHGNQTDDPDNSADIENQIVYTYNDLGQVTESEQSHDGAVSGSTPSVQYAYDHSATSGIFDDGTRLESVTYPDGRVLFSDYGASDEIDDRTGRIKRIRETSGTGTILAEYSKTGAGRIAVTDYQVPDLKLDLFGGTSGTYAGWDRFGRTTDHRWYNYTSGTIDRARYRYGFDHKGRQTWKEDAVADSSGADLDEFYSYEGLSRLTAVDRGDLNGGKTAIDTLAFGQAWDLDQLGNWSSFTEDSNGNGSNELDQDRGHNDANEITDIDSTSTYVGHDAAGNMTTVPKPDAWSAQYGLTWDAWNRLVKVVDGSTTIAEYQYDGLNRRVVKKLYDSGSLSETRHIFLSAADQILEERVDSSTDADRQFTWGAGFIDALILRTRDTDSNGSLDESLYALQDARWNVTALIDTSGSALERIIYNAYGASTIVEADFSADTDGVSDYDWEFRFTGREADRETGLHYFRARYYHCRIGRFLGRDPMTYVDGMNLYAGYFVPLGVDPLGSSQSTCTPRDTHLLSMQPIGGNTTTDIGVQIVTMRPFTPGKCGAFSWTIKWRLKHYAGPAGGYIRQHVRIWVRIKNCWGITKRNDYTEFWEAFYVPRNLNVSNVHDTFSFGGSPCTTGTYHSLGMYTFIPGPIPPSYSKPPPNYPSGGLPTARDNPGESVQNERKHRIFVMWDCCCRKGFINHIPLGNAQ